MWWRLPETNQHKDPTALKLRRLLNNVWTLLSSRVFLGYAGCTTVGYAGMMAYVTASPFLIQTTIGVGPVAYGWLALVLAGGLGLGGFLNIHLVRRLGIDRMITGSLSVMLAAALAVLLLGIGWTNLWTLMPPIFVFETALACLFANAYAGALTLP